MLATPFSTGGGGTNFEQAFAATQLVALLGGQSVLLVGDDVRLGSVRFQAAGVSDVDDLLLSSDLADGPVRTVAVALRHDPTIASSDDDFVALLAAIANTFAKNRCAAFPITLSFARQVGSIMAEVPDGQAPHPAYRFYM